MQKINNFINGFLLEKSKLIKFVNAKLPKKKRKVLNRISLCNEYSITENTKTSIKENFFAITIAMMKHFYTYYAVRFVVNTGRQKKI